MVNAHWKADQLEAHLAARSGRAPRTIFRREAALLETGGGVKAALHALGSAPFFVVNGDAFWLDGPRPALDRLAAAFDPAKVDGVLLVHRTFQVHADVGMGDFVVDKWGGLRRRGEREVVPYIYAGLQLITPALLAGTPEGAFSMNRAWDTAMAAGRLRAVVHDGLVVPSVHAGRPGRGGDHPACAIDGDHPLNLFTIPPGVAFLDTLAAEWLASAADPLQAARGLILLPTRRAARSLAEAFLRASGGQSMLLPRITALGALDEAPLALAGALDLPPAVEPAQRLAALARLILAMGGADGAPRTADRAWMLAGELAALMDEAERTEIDLAARLPAATDPAFAAHWARTLQFLHIVTRAWPDWLAEQGLTNPAARQVALLNAQSAAWEQEPPADRVLVAGTTGGIPAVARLLRVVARLSTGAVALPGLDTDMADEFWAELDVSHPQAGLARLLHGLGATRGDVRPWPAAAPDAALASRSATIACALLPAKGLAEWPYAAPAAVGGLSLLSTADQQEEAAAIAMVLRGALEMPGAQAALVTPDRDLAGRVATELLRYGVVADDSAGEKLSDTPPAVFFRLLVRAVADELAPVPLLALLKHPLAAAGLSPAVCRARARMLELACLRGPRSRPGLVGLRRALDRAGAEPEVVALLGRIETCLGPALRIAASIELAPAQGLAALIEAAERLAGTDELPGPARLWAGEEGEALATRLAEVQAALPLLPDQRRDVLPGLLDAVLEGAVVRSRRALRGRDGTEHPRVFIWGLLEARLQTADVMVLGGLAEGVWPPAERSRTVAVASDAGDGRACLHRRKSSARRRTTSSPVSVPRRPWCCPARVGWTALRSCRRAGSRDWRPCWPAKSRPCRCIRLLPGCARWISPRARRGRFVRRVRARRSRCGHAGFRSPRSRPGCAIRMRSMPGMCCVCRR